MFLICLILGTIIVILATVTILDDEGPGAALMILGLILLFCGGGLTYRAGYEHGQIDAINGKIVMKKVDTVEYQRVETTQPQ